MRVLKWTVEVDDLPHPIGSGKVVLVAAQHSDSSVQVWTEESRDRDHPGIFKAVQIYGTGHDIPDEAEHVGSCLALNGRLVWHLYAVAQ